MWDGYLALAGNEIVNTARATAYARNAGLAVQCDPCESAASVIGDPPYWQVDEDAPWWDPAMPQSAGFLGVFGLDVAGFNTNPVSRTPTALIGGGSVLGPLTRTHREITFTVALIATGECELAYGLEWLSAALLGSACGGDSCSSGDVACLFGCCPGTSPYSPDGTADLRYLYDVGLLEGPSVTEKEYIPGGPCGARRGEFIWATVTFTLAAAKPWIYREPLATLVDWVPLGGGETVTVDPDQVYEECLTPEPCLTDPKCPPPYLPPAPPVPKSPCYPSGRAKFRRSRIQVSPLEQGQWLETVPVLEVQAGGNDMRRLLVRFWANPQNSPCEDYSDPCNACADINLPYLPSGSRLTVDGRVQRSVVECEQYPIGTATATPTIYGAQGAHFDWPVFTCPTGLCIEVWSLSQYTAPDATARVLLVPRSDVG